MKFIDTLGNYRARAITRYNYVYITCNYTYVA